MTKRDTRFLLLLVAAALLLRLFRIGHQSLWVDEVLTLTVSDPKPGLNIWDYLKYNIHGPLHALIVYLFNLLSANDGWLRLPSALAGAGAVYYFFRWIRVWMGPRVAWIATVLLVVNPLHLYYSQELRNYSLLFFFATFSSYRFHLLLRSETRVRLIVYSLGIVAAALCNFCTAFLFAVHSTIYLFRRGFGVERLLHWVAVSIVILVLISPWVYRVYTFIDVSALVTPVLPGDIGTEERLRGETTVSASVIPYTFFVFNVGFSLGPSTRELHTGASLGAVVRRHGFAVAWVGLLFGVVLALGARAAMRCRRRALEVGLYLLVPLAFTLLLCWQNAKAFNVRYVLLSLPAWLVLLAMGADSLGPRLGRVMLAIAAGTMAFSSGNYYFNPRYAREDVRAAARAVESHSAPGDCILVPAATEVFQHYYQGDNPVHAFYTTGMPADRLEAQWERLFATCDTIWYVRTREWVHDSEGGLLQRLDSEYEVVEHIKYQGVTVFRCAR